MDNTLKFIDVLRLAKVFALKKQSDFLSKEHVIQALAYFVPVDSYTDGIITTDLLDNKWPCAPKNSKFSGAELLNKFFSDAQLLPFTEDIKIFAQNHEVTKNLEFAWADIPSVGRHPSVFSTMRTLRNKLESVVWDQASAIDIICKGLLQNELDPSPSIPPSFLLVGPSGSGKTLLLNTLAQELDDGWSYLSLDMQTFQNEKEGFGLTGLRKGWGDAAPGLLTSFVQKSPKSIIVFDNFDSAHPTNLALLSSLFTTGKIRDAFGFYHENDASKKVFADPVVDFSKCLLFFVTNHGEAVYERANFMRAFGERSQQIDGIIIAHLARLKSELNKDMFAIPAALSKNLGNGKVAIFSRLGVNAMIGIIRQALAEQSKYLAEHHKVNILLPEGSAFATMLLIAQAPLISTAKLASKAIALLHDPIVRHLLDKADRIQQIKVELSIGDESVINERVDQDGDRLVERMSLNNETLNYSSQIIVDNDTLTLKFFDLAIVKIPSIEDYTGKGAFRIEMPAVRFTDIAGHTKIKKRLAETVHLLTSPDTLKEYKTNQPKGMLLYGAPGTGKTMLAKALACEAKLPFIATTGPELLDFEYVQTLFSRARRYAPAIIFIDEIDVVGRRDQGGSGLIINQILAELDGFDNDSENNIFVIVATNYPDRIDPAILRSGRIDLHIEIPILDRDARGYFVERYMVLPHEPTFDKDRVLAFTTGMTGADLEKVRRESVLEMIRTGQTLLTEKIVLEQINIIKYGTRVEDPRLQYALQGTAYHEAGHAIISCITQPHVKIEQITVAPRDKTLGFVSFDSESSIYHPLTAESVKAQVCSALAGRLAQSKQFNEQGRTAGAESDLEKATKLCWLAVAEWWLDDIAPTALNWSGLPVSARTAVEEKFAIRVQAWLEEATAKTNKLLDENWSAVDALAKSLIKDEIIDSVELNAILIKYGIVPQT
jgi:ATP-dependent Zn protease